MKKKSNSKSAFFNLRVLIAAVFCLGCIAAALVATTTPDPADGNRTADVDNVDFVSPDGDETPTATPDSCAWSFAPIMQSVGVRSSGVSFRAIFTPSRT